MDSALLTYYAVLALPAIWLLVCLWPSKNKLSHIPTVGGPSLPLLSYIGAVRYFFHASDIIQEGYRMHKGSVFKHASLGSSAWHVVVCDRKLMDELHKAPDDQLSFLEATNEDLQGNHTLGPAVTYDPYHIPIVRSQLTRALTATFSELRDEICQAFYDEIPPTDSWSKVKVFDTIMEIVCRTSNRLFVGLPLCRNRDWCELNKQFTIDVFAGATIINMFPPFLKPIAGRLFTNVPKSIRRGVRHLQPMIEERYRLMEEYGAEWTDKPNDMLQWLIDAAKGVERGVPELTLRMLTVNMAAIHTSSITFTNALFNLAAYPEFVPALREEVETILKNEGWTKAAISKMRKVDSFLKESQRRAGLRAEVMDRLALRDFSFSDGTFIPKGTVLTANLHGTHFDFEHYENPEVFCPFRFSEMRSEEGEGIKHSMVSTSLDYLPFGHGRHSCPGRFFAANELKAMLAHIVLTYDVKMENDGMLPEPVWMGRNQLPSKTAEVLFRKRQT